MDMRRPADVCMCNIIGTSRLGDEHPSDVYAAEPLAAYVFCASAAVYTYEPVLKSLQEMYSIPLGDTLVHLQKPEAPMELAHGGKQVHHLSEEIRKAVVSDPKQEEALQLMMDSRVVLVQVIRPEGYLCPQPQFNMRVDSHRWAC